MKYLFSTIIIVLIGTSVFSQKRLKPFTGILEYKISARDSAFSEVLPNFPMIIYTNDTIVRKENFTNQLGTQVTIQHTALNKAYLLLHTKMGKFAIKTDLNKIPAKSDTTKSKYTFSKKMFRKKVLGMKAKRIIAHHDAFEEPIEFLYLKKRSNKYNNVFPEVPGLLVKYSVVTPDGILDYELVKMNEYSPNRDMFGIPSDYKKVTFDEFIDIMTSPDNQKTISPDEMN